MGESNEKSGSSSLLHIDYLIVGTGPAGGSLAAFMASYDILTYFLIKGEYELASPSEMMDLPQTLLEPLLTRYATLNGFKCRFDTELVTFEQDENGVTTTLLDKLSKTVFQVRSKYLFGADGARSKIVQQAQIPMIRRPSQGFAVNLLFQADLSHLMETRKGNLHCILQPDRENPEWAVLGIIRMVKPWHEWLCILFPAPDAPREIRSDEEYLQRIRELIGDDSVKVKLLSVSTWAINETVAEYYSKGNVASTSWTATGYSWIRANQSLRNQRSLWETLGITEPTLEARLKVQNEISADSPEGRARRERLSKVFRTIDVEEHGLGMEMNQRYVSSATYQADQGEMPAFTRDRVRYYQPTTYPGARLPHAWLGNHIPSKYISTIDLAGKGQFTLFTGIGGQHWKKAAEQLSSELGIPIKAYSIGYAQDYKDIYLDWEGIRGVDESGCVLVRPDYFVAWRSQKWEEDSPSKLKKALKSVLSLH
ncbi:hypothetical protein Daesc_009123 [Daldinia eschscholtzii]|uniref:FAD-binding domain-containing protein n=1 Tax=Daldinia eschscholtzii TaxID=292717 RepID=A0AAX6M8R6_9PEZI